MDVLMKKLCFVIPYFGKLPNYFQLFLNTCATNEKYDWIVFTDDSTTYRYPQNVKMVYMTFNECQRLVESKFDFHVSLAEPYKLCDLKPMYGYIFEQYLEDYKFWGHCDVDTLMGNLGNWLTDEFLELYDKIFCLGHMTIYRNTEENNKVFMNPYKGKDIYKDVLCKSDIYTFDECWRDNVNIDVLFEECRKRIFKQDYSMNVACPYNRFHRIEYLGRDKCPELNGYKIEDYRDALYIWEKGNLYRLYCEDGKLKKEEFLYMHLQWRKMGMKGGVEQKETFKIVNDEFLPLLNVPHDIYEFNKEKKHGFCFHRQRVFCERLFRFIKRKMFIVC